MPGKQATSSAKWLGSAADTVRLAQASPLCTRTRQHAQCDGIKAFPCNRSSAPGAASRLQSPDLLSNRLHSCAHAHADDAALVACRGAAHAAADKPKVATGPITSELCDSGCESKISSSTREKTSTGLEYVDILVGKGPKPAKGYQVAVNYIAMTPDGKVFDSSFEKGRSYDIRCAAIAVVVASTRAASCHTGRLNFGMCDLNNSRRTGEGVHSLNQRPHQQHLTT